MQEKCENTGHEFTIPSITNGQIPNVPITGVQEQRMRLQCKISLSHCLKAELPISWNQEDYEYSLSNRVLYRYSSYSRKIQNSFSEYESDESDDRCEVLVSLLSNRIGHRMQTADKIH